MTSRNLKHGQRGGSKGRDRAWLSGEKRFCSKHVKGYLKKEEPGE
ncbi:MAG: hypothetical protein V3U72_02725 [Candidatus Aenigmarchaeota archaeon]